MGERELNERTGEAWKAHYTGNQQLAIDQFLTIVSEAPEDIDANWGLALSYRDAGDRDKAVEIFTKVRDLVSRQLDAAPDNYERFFMLKRMAIQHIEQMDQFIR